MYLYSNVKFNTFIVTSLVSNYHLKVEKQLNI